MRNIGRRWLSALIAGVMPLTGWLFPAAAAAKDKAAVEPALVKRSESIVTSGVRLMEYVWVTGGATPVEKPVHALRIDLSNPYVRLDVMGGRGGSVTARRTVGEMAKDTGAVAGVNGDVFDVSKEGAPIGAEIRGGQLYSSTSKLQGMYAFGVTGNGIAVIDEYVFRGTVTAQDGAQFELAGVNKSAYTTEPDRSPSHYNALFMYTSAWTAAQRPEDSHTSPTEALVVDGVVTAVSPDRNTPLAIEAIPENGYILRGHRDAADFILQHLTVGSKVSVHYELVASDGTVHPPSDFRMLIGGHTLLVENGQASAFSRSVSGIDGTRERARTAVGHSRDGKTVWLVTVQESGGMTLAELQQVLVKLGVWKAVNLDGGGSTTMVARPLGEFDAVQVHPVSNGAQRAVSNGIGVYTTAPPGEPAGLLVSGPQTLFLGQKAEYGLKAYDEYYNPVDLFGSGRTPRLSLDRPVAVVEGATLIPTKPGKAELTVRVDNASAKVGLEVIGEEQVAEMTIRTGTQEIREGGTVRLAAEVKLADGRVLTVPHESLEWQLIGVRGQVADGVLSVEGFSGDSGVVYAIARYAGYGTAAAFFPAPNRSLEDFENVGYAVRFEGLPAETVGAADVVTGLPGRETSRALRLAYDFTLGTGDRFAYAVLGDGIPLPGGAEASGTVEEQQTGASGPAGADGATGMAAGAEPSALSVDVLGDGSNNWLRAEFRDAAGRSVLVTLADRIDWTGWKTVFLDPEAAGVSGMKLTRLYVVNLERGQNGRELKGEIAFDNLKLHYPATEAEPPRAEIVLKSGSPEALLNGNAIRLDAAPFQQDGVTYVPLRFIADSLGGSVLWDNGLKRVTVLRDSGMVEMRAGSPDMTVNGVRQAAAASPLVRNGRVMVPLRVVAEQLDLQVVWDGQAKTVTIY